MPKAAKMNSRARYAALHALVVASAVASPANAYDRWNRSGFSLDHHFYSDRRYPEGNMQDGPLIIHVAPGYNGPTPAELDKVQRDQRACRPVVLYDDAGRHETRQDGCVPRR
jgi:hypothetical protein